jgi:polar amino acid transport system substrate-binding protein
MLCTVGSTFSDSEPKSTERIDIQISAGEWPPFLGASLPNQGFISQLITDVFYDAGYNVEFVFLPWVRAYQDTVQGSYSATAVWMYKDDRANDFLYSDPVLNEQFVLFHKKSNSFDWNTIEDLQGKQIGGGLGYSYGSVFDKALEDGTFSMLRLPSVEQNIKMLAAGRIDLFVEEMSVAKYKLQNELPELMDQVAYHPRPVLVNQSFLMLPKNDPNSEKLMKAFNTQLEIFKQDGRYQAYFESGE